ncbi:MAG: hypothetical protein K1X31_13110 [Gemmatimonadaceae bacterium]|nr:hypothetical protein [Gemmatimonadaceae bacterium]
MRRPVIIASILALLSACDKPKAPPAAAAPDRPLTSLSAQSTILFNVFGDATAPRVVPIAVVEGGRVAELVLDAAGWRQLDSMFLAKGRTLTVYRDGAAAGEFTVTRPMFTDEGALYALPGCQLLVPQAEGRLSTELAPDALVDYIASSTPLAQTAQTERMPKDAAEKGRTLANTIAAAREVGPEELGHLNFDARWLPSGAGPAKRTLLASYLDASGGDAGAGAGHSSMILALAEDSAGTLVPSYQHVSSGEARAVDMQRLVNHADLDGDGVDELLIEEWKYAATPEIGVLKYAQGKWRMIFRVPNEWCLDVKPAP